MQDPTEDRADDLPESKLYTFVDASREFSLYFFEGQRLIRDLALLHGIRGAGFAYFRDVVLSVQPMIALLKHGEQLGFYMDSEEPYFRLKIETAQHGATRSMLMPEDFAEFPEAMHGLVRVQKLFPRNQPPYQSVIEAKGLALGEVVNRVLRESYQVNSSVLISEASDQSLLLHQLPPMSGDDYECSDEAVAARRGEIRDDVESIFRRSLVGREEIAEAFATIGFQLLAGRTVSFECSCSEDRVIQSIRPIYLREGSALFDPGRHDLDVKCEYCKTEYLIQRSDLDASSNPLN